MWKKIISLSIVILLSSASAQESSLITWADAPNMPINRHTGDWMLNAGWYTQEELYPKLYPKNNQTGVQLDFPAAMPEFDNRTYTYELKYISDHAYFWFAPETEVSDLEAAAQFFENVSRPINHQLYGDPDSLGIDGDSHLHLIHLQNLGFGAVGLFRIEDQCPPIVCSTSAGRDILYYALSWGAVNSPEHLSTLTHEYQHVIRYAQDGNEKRWMNEGFSQLAEYLAGFELNYVLGENLTAFLNQPTLPLDGWADFNTDPASHYAASFLFVVYLYEQFGEEFIQALSASPYDGLAAVYHTLPSTTNLDQIFINWAIANATNGYSDLDQIIRVNPQAVSFVGVNPKILNGILPAYSARYWELPAGEYQLTFEGATEIPLGATDAYSGEFVWWSYPQDFSAARLTRTVDLQNVTSATLTYQMCYDLEEDFDWGNVMISLDGGNVWKPLQGDRMQAATETIPIAHYTGNANCWIQESIDLSPFTGQVVQIRFEVITDGTYTQSGMRLDDLAIPEIGWFDNAETLDDDWQAEGFIRSNLIAPQTWSLVLISGDEILTLGKNETFNLPETGILMLAGMSPMNTESANYKLVLEKY